MSLDDYIPKLLFDSRFYSHTIITSITFHENTKNTAVLDYGSADVPFDAFLEFYLRRQGWAEMVPDTVEKKRKLHGKSVCAVGFPDIPGCLGDITFDLQILGEFAKGEIKESTRA